MNGEFIAAFGEEGSGDGQFHYPSSVCVDRLGRVLVCDQGHRVQIWSLQYDVVSAACACCLLSILFTAHAICHFALIRVCIARRLLRSPSQTQSRLQSQRAPQHPRLQQHHQRQQQQRHQHHHQQQHLQHQHTLKLWATARCRCILLCHPLSGLLPLRPQQR